MVNMVVGLESEVQVHVSIEKDLFSKLMLLEYVALTTVITVFIGFLSLKCV